jgi:Zn-dependent peptidase ImmA (M78 family)
VLYHKGRINFTIAHEIGHWNLHKYFHENKIMLHTEFAKHTPKLEWQANHFSACLLMPRNLVIKKWNELQFYSVQEKRSILADFFRVSLETMNIRISYLNLI